ncbi:Bis(5'-nucleosyl)-tetraphosphatase, symmetrical [hydrothermal vent metagenome]|uniref:bis(5'-nucleosyl)-tetraphosphatase (symmetrical) n=1 Tax=hydrothermal vent metagenome TaxID=652676 RepID=A0A1W1EEA2_9ZZZZ
MAVWSIGDIQGCNDSLQKLLKKINFEPKKDKLWIAGDLVNRGPKSLEVLEYLYSIKESVVIVLGNHDVALIAAYYGIKKSNEYIDPILKSPKAKVLIEWLREQKFLHVDFTLGYCMSHAGISPEFDLGMAVEYSNRIENKLKGNDVKIWLKQMFKHGSERFDRSASDIDIDRYILSSFIRMRFCYKDRRLDFNQKGKPTQALKKIGLKPWFDCKNRKDIELKIIFGHWSTLGFYNDDNVLSLDTGCVWGGTLTAAKIDSKKIEIVVVDCSKI